ncbi:hypothetical protein [Paenibacillus sp. MMS18-CY102]|uniref:hypothetical protein n=1 Tax=Paenibacillus sp. MMS18-CY102 TaxID=2682849 RepID=UPI001365A561|nr:hypothetical protein [Paenibacillus sp. MMS18-CY102]MWC28771.1 hypothetical protein [Paenibacillus sp. MMS18-CY102]
MVQWGSPLLDYGHIWAILDRISLYELQWEPSEQAIPAVPVVQNATTRQSG